MAKSTRKSQTPKFAYLEQWDTKHGLSDRVVVRQAGRFVDNISLSAIRKGQTVKSR